MATLLVTFHLHCAVTSLKSTQNSRISTNTPRPLFPAFITKPSVLLRASSPSIDGQTSPNSKPTTRKSRKKSPDDAPVKRTRRSTKSPVQKTAQNEPSNDLIAQGDAEEQDRAEEFGGKKSSSAKTRRSTKFSAEETVVNEFSDSELEQENDVGEFSRRKKSSGTKTKRSAKFTAEEIVPNELSESEPEQQNEVEEFSQMKKSSTGKRTRRKTKVVEEDSEQEEPGNVSEDEDVEGIGDEIEVNYESIPLVCCFGAAQREFMPTVRVSERQMHPDRYSTWKQLQWSPPEFVRAPGGPPSNVAISHVRLGGRAVFMGKVGDDEFGKSLVKCLESENVQTRAVKVDSGVKTAASYMKIKFQDSENGAGEKLVAETRKKCAEDSFLKSEIDVSVLKEARIFHFNSEVLLTPAMHSPLFRAIALSKKFGSNVFFDLNLPLPLWRSRDNTREVIKRAWNSADLIEVSRQELEFLLDEKYYENMRNYRPQYYSESYEQTRNRRNTHHYTREEIAPLWHHGIKILFVTDGTLRIHYYTPNFDGVVVGTEDVLITPFTCDRTGSGDAVIAAIMRKLTTHPEIYEDEDKLIRQLRFAIAAGIISQWTIGAVRGFPTESATKNLKEQVYVPSMW